MCVPWKSVNTLSFPHQTREQGLTQTTSHNCPFVDFDVVFDVVLFWTWEVSSQRDQRNNLLPSQATNFHYIIYYYYRGATRGIHLGGSERRPSVQIIRGALRWEILPLFWGGTKFTWGSERCPSLGGHWEGNFTLGGWKDDPPQTTN